MALRLTSPVITNGDAFPVDYTCNGRGVSPPLKIEGVPGEAKSLVLIFDDPDAAKEPAGRGITFDHWLVYNIPAQDQEIAEASAPSGAQFGKNSAGRGDYMGPCPHTFRHKYFFRLLALDCRLDLTDLPTKVQIEQTAKDHVLDKTELTSYYEQPKA